MAANTGERTMFGWVKKNCKFGQAGDSYEALWKEAEPFVASGILDKNIPKGIHLEPFMPTFILKGSSSPYNVIIADPDWFPEQRWLFVRDADDEILGAAPTLKELLEKINSSKPKEGYAEEMYDLFHKRRTPEEETKLRQLIGEHGRPKYMASKDKSWVSRHCKFAQSDMPGFNLEKAQQFGLKPPKKDWGQYDQEQLRKGIEVEKEHTEDVEVCAMIAANHLDEIGDYYTRLDKMESEAKPKGGVETERATSLTMGVPTKE